MRFAARSLLLFFLIALVGSHTVAAQPLTVNPPDCYSLTLKVVGGRGEVPKPAIRPNCGKDRYRAGTRVPLTGSPDFNFGVHRWSGTDDDTVRSTDHAVTIESDTVVTIHYVSNEDPAQEVNRDSPGGGVARAPVTSPTKSVIGTDQRVRIFDTTSDPWRRNAQLEVTFPLGSGICTGFFVGPDVIATAGHCVYDSDFGGWATTIAVIPGRDGSGFADEPFGRQDATNLWSVNGWVNSGLADHDYGAIILPNSLLAATMGLGLDYYYIDVFTDAEILNFTGNLAGYPGDQAFGTLWYDFRTTTTVGNKVSYEIDTFGGQSGSAVYVILNSPRRYAFAIHTNGVGSPSCNFGDNCGTRIRQEVADFFFRRGAALFADGFETGDLSAW